MKTKKKNIPDKRPWYIYLISGSIIILGLAFLIPTTMGIINEKRIIENVQKQVDYYTITAKILIGVICIFIMITAIFIFFLKSISIKLIYVDIILLAAVLYFMGNRFLLPFELIGGGALVEFLKKAKQNGKKLFSEKN